VNYLYQHIDTVVTRCGANNLFFSRRSFNKLAETVKASVYAERGYLPACFSIFYSDNNIAEQGFDNFVMTSPAIKKSIVVIAYK